MRDNWVVELSKVPVVAPPEPEGTPMWTWIVILGFVVTVVLLARWIDRGRGSQGASRSLDLPVTKQGRPRHIDTNDGFNGM